MAVGVPVTPVPSSRSETASSRSIAAVGEATGSLIAAAEAMMAATITLRLECRKLSWALLNVELPPPEDEAQRRA